MKTSVAKLLSLLIATMMLASCASQKVIAMKLDDAIIDITNKTRAVQCQTQAPVQGVSLELFVKTAAELEAGAPIGVAPVTIGGKVSAEESSKIVVTMGKLECSPAAMSMLQSVQERWKPTLYWYEPQTGKLEPVQRDK